MFSPKNQFPAAFLLTAALPLVAYSQVYLTEDQALQTMFPGEKFVRKTVTLTSEQIKTIEDRADDKVRNNPVVAWVGDRHDVVLLDQALGKHEFITYALGIDAQGAVKDVEILEYRETYGYQVREVKWRAQFVGKKAAQPLRLGKEIVNISGATLSSSHLTAGVRRLLQTYDVAKAQL